MNYVEVTTEEAINILKQSKGKKVLVAIQNLEDDDCDIAFVQKKKEECEKLLENVKTVASSVDDLVKQLRCFTEKQDIKNIRPIGVQKTVLLKI